MNNMFKILAIDGGGIRGVFAAHILKRIKEEFNIKFYKEFDIIVGTSTGSIIAAGLAIDLPIQRIVYLYKEKGKEIFTKQKFNFFNLFKSKYDNKHLARILKEEFGDKTLSDAKTKLIMPSTDISNGDVFVFKSGYNENFVRDRDIYLADALLASCSAPLYFDPVKINEYLLTDGGLWANNPSLIALTEAMGHRIKIPKEKIKILSLGSGLGKKYYNPQDYCKRWGFKQWGTGLVNTIMNLQTTNVDNIVNFILDDKEKFLRINFETDYSMALDDVDNVGALLSRADGLFSCYFEKIKAFFKEGKK